MVWYLVTSYGALRYCFSICLRAHRLDDLGELVGQEFVLLDLVVVEIDGDAQQRPAEAVAVGRIEIEIDVAIAVHAAVDAGARLDVLR